MPVTLVLRRQADHSPFRKLLLDLVKAPGASDLIIGSGYIWEPGDGRYSVLSDELGDSIAAGCAGGTVTTIAGKLSRGIWRTHYDNFVAGLRARNLVVNALVAPQKNWHAKLAIRHTHGGEALAALVGSSNLTRPAYGEPYRAWNYECDALIWPDDAGLTTHFRGLLTAAAEDRILHMDLILDPKVRQPTEREQLEHLRQQVLGSRLDSLKA